MLYDLTTILFNSYGFAPTLALYSGLVVLPLHLAFTVFERKEHAAFVKRVVDSNN